MKFTYTLVRPTAKMLLIAIALQTFLPLKVLALTSGPSQPEVQSFEPAETSQMVELSSGDFTYNIPLLEVPGPNGGYPINLAYHSGIAADQEASWTGLGWNLNVGNINRNMRGLPDDFDGDLVGHKQDMKPNTTVGAKVKLGDLEIFGNEKLKINANVGAKVYYNTYKGFGIGTELGVGITLGGDGLNGNIGLNISNDSQEGIGINPSLGMSVSQKGNENNQLGFGVSANYNSRVGLMGVSLNIDASVKPNNKERKIQYSKTSASSSASLSFVNRSYTPQQKVAMSNRNFTGHFKIGASLVGVYPSLYGSGFYYTEKMAQRNILLTNPAYGYNAYQNAISPKALMDFNREKDGVIYPNTPILPMPVTQYDVYAVTGQGIGSMFRAHRNDIGILKDPMVMSLTKGGSLGLETGIKHPIGLSGEFNFGMSLSGNWKEIGDIQSVYRFRGKTGNPAQYEPYYYKTYGEMTSCSPSELASIGGTEPVHIELKKKGTDDAVTQAGLFNQKKQKTVALNSSMSERKPRNVAIQEIKNQDIILNDEIFNELDTKYFDNNNTKQSLQRNNAIRKVHHTGAFIATNAEGMRYVYGLPAYNTKQIERTFSVPGQTLSTCGPMVNVPITNGQFDYKHGEQSLDETHLPPYAHSYLLTSTLGADYIDVDNNGPSDKDFGYWANFTYRKTSDNFKWRAPFSKANYLKGAESKASDDRGSFVYGEKEIWYLATIETKTHIAEFTISQRLDGRGASSELQNSNVLGDYSYKLDKISLYTKAERLANGVLNPNAVPVKEVNFEYDYSLCENVLNTSGTGNNTGKLTLKKLYFTYKKNNRGKSSPYIFDYHENISSENPDYATHAYDRWGNYKPYGNDVCNNVYSPYVAQFSKNPYASDIAFKDTIDTNAAVWNLKEIKLPSGGKIKVEYESDDYGYVQNKTAMQMHPITSVGAGNGNNIMDNGSKRVFFSLEKPIPNSLSASQRQKALWKLLDASRKVYFKLYCDLKNDSWEYVSGYADAESIEVDVNSQINGKYTAAYIKLKPTKIKKKTYSNFHPFAVAAWNHLKMNRPEIAYNASFNMRDPDNLKKREKLEQLVSLFSMVTQIAPMIMGYYRYANMNGFGKEINLNRSFIRLNSADKIKYGGGCRVKRLSISDEWQQGTAQAKEYGQTYDYTMEEDGQVISSGVASYEPMIGGEEIALRNPSPDVYDQKVPLATGMNLYAELPILESYFPAPSVVYRKVMVKSLTSDQVLKGNLPPEIMTTGAMVQEFYTAKEFPVITAYTPLRSDKGATSRISGNPAPRMIPFIGQMTKSYLMASQGFVVELNDMHGKLRGVKHYAIDGAGKLTKEPYKWVRYDYLTESKKFTANNLPAMKLRNHVEVLTEQGKEPRLMGLEYEFFADMRQSISNSFSVGLNFNIDLVFFAIPIPSLWPSISTDEKKVKIATTTKVIHRFGILKKTTAFSDGALVETENMLFDALTGEPLLTKVTNDFGDPIFHYSQPARWYYSGMDAAYKNIGVEVNGLSFFANASCGNNWVLASTNNATLFHAGDELLCTPTPPPPNGNGMTKKKAYCMKVSNDKIWVEGIPVGPWNVKIIRSGRRNLLTAKVGQVTSLKNPITQSTAVSGN